MLHTLTVTDTISGSRSQLFYNGWSGGRQQQSYSFYTNSGGVISIKDLKIFALKRYFDTIILGDSITEGIMVYDKSKRWCKLMEPHIKGSLGVCARSGQTLVDIINKFDSELGILKPKYAIFLIGINNINNATVENYTILRDKCLAAGINPKFCLLTCTNGSDHNTINSRIIQAVKESEIGFKFNLATSLNNNGQNINSALFYDNLHPIEVGCQEMLKRVFIDIPEILK